LNQPLEDLHREYGVSVNELHSMQRDRDNYHDDALEAEAGLHRQQSEVTQRDGVITKLNDKVDKMRGDSLICISSLKNSETSGQSWGRSSKI
jgi:hypothetical protein